MLIHISKNCLVNILTKSLFMNIILPFKTLNYFEIYLNLLTSIIIQKDKYHILAIKTLNFLSYIKAFHFLFLTLYPLTKLERVLHFDAAYTLVPKATFSLMFFGAEFIVITYGNRNLFLNANYHLNVFLHKIMFQNDGSFFIKSKYKNKLIFVQIKKYFLYFANMLQSLVFIVGMFLK